VEGGVGTHKSALMQAWVAQEMGAPRVLVEFDHRQLSPAVMAGRLAYQFQVDGFAVGTETAEVDDWDAFVAPIREAVALSAEPITVGVQRMDELPVQASKALIDLVATLSGFRLVATAVDAQQLINLAVSAKLSHQVIGDAELAYTSVEVSAMLAEALPHATEVTVRAILEATHGVPVLVERVIELFGEECLAGTISIEQAIGGWTPQREGATEFHTQTRQLARVPTITVELLTCLYGAERADYLFSRLVGMGWGTITQGLSAARQFVWFPAVRWHLSQVWPGDSAEAEADRALIADCAQQCGEPGLAVAMLVANQALADADAVAGHWLWELVDADGGLLLELFVATDPSVLSDYPNLLVVATLVLPSRGELPADPELVNAQRAVLSGPIGGTVADQLTYLAKAATLALGIGEIGVAIRATIRWATLIQSKPEEWADLIGPGFVSDSLLMVKTMVQLGRIDLVPGIAQALLSQLRRSPEAVGGVGELRMSTLISTLRMAAVFLGTARAELRTVQLAPRQFHREFDHMIHGVIDSGEAFDRGDFASAEAFTRVAMFRLPHPTDWPMLVYLRAVALVATGNREGLDELIDQVLSTPRWNAWQHHSEAPGCYAMVAEIIVMAATGRSWGRPLAEVAGYVRSLPPGATHRWPPWGRRLLEGMIQVGTGAARAAELPTDGELPPAPRVAWQLALLTAVNNLRAGEEATAVAVLVRGGAALKYQAAPLPLVLASPTEIGTLIERLPANAAPIVRGSLGLAAAYVGVDHDSRGAVRLATRELEVLDGVRRGLTNTAIARELYVSVNTVKFHRTNLYRKLNATSREELLAEALRQGL
jgi:DNA-binding CsgD family transcriptional regulator